MIKEKKRNVNLRSPKSRDASKSNFLDTGDHRGSPLQAFVGAGLRACPKILHFGRL